MTNKATKRALLTSVFSLLLCFVMLIGTTFAWFTDTVTSTGNIITSGTLDVAMYYADGKTDPATTSWTDASAANVHIFNYDKWEPGYVDVKHIKIANEGTLALKYQVAIAANGAVSDLADVIDVYYADPAVQVADRAAVANATKLGTLTDVLAGMATTAYGELAASEEHTLTLALKMQESAGNEYQNKSIGTDFSVKVVATQLDAELDSFGPEYDEDAFIDTDLPWSTSADTSWYVEGTDDYTLSTASEIAGLAALVNKGDATDVNITLGANIDLLNNNWVAIGTEANKFNGTFDGAGYTISNLAITDAKTCALFGYVDSDAVIKNVTFEDVNIYCNETSGGRAAAAVAYVANDVENITISNIKVLSGTIKSENYAGGIVCYIGGDNHTVSGCVNYADITALRGGGIGGSLVATNQTIKDCTNYGDVETTHRSAGIACTALGTISNCVNYGKISNGSQSSEPAGGIVSIQYGAMNIKDCVNYGDVTSNGSDIYNASAAGIIGHNPGAHATTVESCKNEGAIVSTNSYAAGIAVSFYGGINAINCENTGDVTGPKGAEAIVSARGAFSGTNTATNCTNSGVITVA